MERGCWLKGFSLDGEPEQEGHKEAFPAPETAERAINQSWEARQQRGFRTTDSSQAPPPRTQVAWFPVPLLSTALHLSVQGGSPGAARRRWGSSTSTRNFFPAVTAGGKTTAKDFPEEKEGFFPPAFYVLTNTSSLCMVQRSQKFVTAKEKASFAFVYQIQ